MSIIGSTSTGAMEPMQRPHSLALSRRAQAGILLAVHQSVQQKQLGNRVHLVHTQPALYAAKWGSCSCTSVSPAEAGGLQLPSGAQPACPPCSRRDCGERFAALGSLHLRQCIQQQDFGTAVPY